MSSGYALDGRWALVTGASRGIGRATAVHLARQGANVIVHYHKRKENAEATARLVEEEGGRARVLGADLERLEEIERLFETVSSETGHLDILVANAAATAFKQIEDVRAHHLERSFNLILRSLVRMVQLAVPLMEGREGRVITVSGHGTPFTLPKYVVLGSVKGAVEAFTRYAAYEFAPKGITCNCVSPGVIDTDSARYYMGDAYGAFMDRVSAATPVGRMGTPEDVAALVGFLASSESRFVTGQVIRVDGGISLTSAPFLEEA